MWSKSKQNRFLWQGRVKKVFAERNRIRQISVLFNRGLRLTLYSFDGQTWKVDSGLLVISKGVILAVVVF